MSSAEGIAALKDIHLPMPVGFWPLAPGWYLLMVLVFMLGFSLLYFGYRKTAHARPRKQALALLKQYQSLYEKDKNSQLICSRVSELIRRVALVYYPREQVAGLHGDAWIAFLNETAKGVDFKPVQYLLLELPFKPSQDVNLEPLFTQTIIWIKQRGVPCSN